MAAIIADTTITQDCGGRVAIQAGVVVAAGGMVVALAGQAHVGLLVANASAPGLAIVERRALLAGRACGLVLAEALEQGAAVLRYTAVAVAVAAAAGGQLHVTHAINGRHIGGDLAKTVTRCLQRMEAFQLQAQVSVIVVCREKNLGCGGERGCG